MSLEIKNLHAKIHDKTILNGLSLTLPAGEVHAIMGPNGAGKSTLSKILCGHEDYIVTEGEVLMDGENLLEMSVDARSRAGLFLAFQYPLEIPGVSNANFLLVPLQARLPKGRTSMPSIFIRRSTRKWIPSRSLEISRRSVNEGFSGGEKEKRVEILQMAMLEPKYAVLDETDSGLDIDALKIVSEGVNAMRSADRGFLVITHYQRLLDYIKPDVVHVLSAGRIVKSGGPELALELEERGYDWINMLPGPL